MGISDYLVQVENLTNTNLKILSALNESLSTDKNYVGVDLGGENIFNIPSILNLENKINALQNNFENLVNAPITSEASFTFSGDSRTIQLKQYEQAPAPVELNVPAEFFHESNSVLKDFITPVPYLKFDISGAPNDINSFMVRKVAAVSNKAKERFRNLLDGEEATKKVNWGDLFKVINDLKQDTDYVLYDTIKRFPVREGQGDGVYVIQSIDDDFIDENLDQHVVITFHNDLEGRNSIYRNDLTYLLFDQTIEKSLKVGDYLVAFDGHAKFQIEKLNYDTNSVQLKILYGEYINLTPWNGEGDEDISSVSKIKFFSNYDPFSEQSYIKVPLEEDQYIFVAIAALNDRMNIRSSWGEGLLVNVYGLYTGEGGDKESFEKYYENCRNIGDILNEISKVMSNTTTSHSTDELNSYMAAKPELDTDIIKVIHINKHLDESTTIKNIRALYSQKNEYNASLTEIQTSLTALQDQLSAVDFQDTTGIRTKLQNQISSLTQQKNDLINSLIKISDEIALTANNSVVPIENAKYRIRGFFDFNRFVQNLQDDDTHHITPDNIKGIYVQYRYRNIQLETGEAETFTKDYDNSGSITENETYIFSDWNQLYTPLRLRIRDKEGNYVPEEDTSNKNLPSFNQIDIPITQGENVDVRLKVIYDFGYPFIQMMSDWSDIVTFEFPVEFLKDVQITDILKENNNDIETNRFNTILNNNGITKHVDDYILDQDVTFFHKPENISSGFYTPERRIIPLRDKLKTMDDSITRIIDEIEGTTAENLSVYIDYDGASVQLSPFEVGNVLLKSASSFVDGPTGVIGNYNYTSDGADAHNGLISISCNIRLVNTSQHSLKIFSMFPGTDNTVLNALTYTKFDKTDYCQTVVDTTDPLHPIYTYNGVWISDPKADDGTRGLKLQTTNQILTFRINNPYDGTPYYAADNVYTNSTLSWLSGYTSMIGPGHDRYTYGMAVYPYNVKSDGLLMTFKEAYSYMLLNPGDEYIFPIMVEYRLQQTPINIIEKTLAFDIRTSLYNDPIHYTTKIGAKWEDTVSDKLVSALNKTYTTTALNNKEYNPIVR